MREESPRNTKKVLEMVDYLFIILMVAMVSQVSTPVHFEYTQLIVCQLHLNKTVFFKNNNTTAIFLLLVCSSHRVAGSQGMCFVSLALAWMLSLDAGGVRQHLGDPGDIISSSLPACFI